MAVSGVSATSSAEFIGRLSVQKVNKSAPKRRDARDADELSLIRRPARVHGHGCLE